MKTWLRTDPWALALILLGVVLLWNTWLVYPLKILVVFFHEVSHGVAAILTGGEVIEIRLQKEQGGVCVTRGGSRFVILTAGYLGSLVFGGAILLMAARSRNDKRLTLGLGVLLLVVTLWLIRPWFGFGMVFGLATGATLLAAAVYLANETNDLLLRVIGIVSCLYAVLDIKSDVLDRPDARSDAHLLAEQSGIPTLAWGVLWIAIAIAATFFFLRAASRLRQTAGSAEAPRSQKTP